MKRYNAQADRVNLGPFTDLFILGATRGANGGSDFTDADLSQDITLMTPAAGDQLIPPLVAAFTKTGFVGPGPVTSLALSVGAGAGGVEGISAGAAFAQNASLAGGAGGGIVFTGSNTLSVRVVSVGGNLNVITAGEIWIYVALLRISDRLHSLVA